MPEHYFEDWQIDHGYEGDPMFRPAGTTPGHALEIARLLVQYGTLAGEPAALPLARLLTDTALQDGWLPEGGLAYTVDPAGQILRRNRYWWPVAEGLNTLAALMKADPQPQDGVWFNKLWAFAQAHFCDAEFGGWFPEIDAEGKPAAQQFMGKPDIYHALQAMLYPLCPGNVRFLAQLETLEPRAPERKDIHAPT